MNDWRVRPVFDDARVTVLVVESTELLPSTSPGACHLVASLQPEAIVVSHDDGVLVFDPEGAANSVDSLGERFEGVARAISAALS